MTEAEEMEHSTARVLGELRAFIARCWLHEPATSPRCALFRAHRWAICPAASTPILTSSGQAKVCKFAGSR